MRELLAVLAGTMMSAVSLIPAAMAQAPCVTQNIAVPPGANTTDKAAPFFIDTTGLDFKTQPPTRDPSNPNYPRATELTDGALPPPGAEGNFIIGPTHAPATPARGRARSTCMFRRRSRAAHRLRSSSWATAPPRRGRIWAPCSTT